MEVGESGGFVTATQSVQADGKSRVPPSSGPTMEYCGGEDTAGSQDTCNLYGATCEGGLHQQGTCYSIELLISSVLIM